MAIFAEGMSFLEGGKLVLIYACPYAVTMYVKALGQG